MKKYGMPLRLHDVFYGMLILNKRDNTHLRLTCGTLPPSLKLRWTSKRIRFTCPPKPCAKEDARGPVALSELASVIAL
jgi:hypothetical protein